MKASGDGNVRLIPKRGRRRVPAEVAQLDPACVARRAFALFLERGAQHGYDIDDWLKAERQLRVEPRGAAE